MLKLTLPQKFLLFLFLSIVFLYSFNQLKESDAFYHLKTGQVIFETKGIPHYDIFSYTAGGAEWITHEWLAELIFYFIYKLLGFWGLISFVAFIAGLTYYLIFYLALKKGANFYLTILFSFLLGHLTFKFWIPRPQIFAYLAFIILILLLENYRREPKKRYLWFIILNIWFWANVNASVILGLVILIFYFVAGTVQNNNRKTLTNLGLASAVATLVSFINPNSYKIFLYSFYIRPTVQTLKILEWKSIVFFWREPDIIVFLTVMILADIFLVWYFLFRKESRDLILFGLVMGISILPFISLRHYAFWPLIVIGLFSVAASDVLKGIIKKISARRFSIFVFLFCLIFLTTRYFTFPRLSVNEYLLPVRAADFIEANKLKGPFFNLYNEGGYLIWRFWPREKIFIDSRSEIYGSQQLEELFVVVRDLDGWSELVNKKYRLNYFILSYWPEALAKSIQPLVFRLVRENWSLVYWDDAAIIFIRNSPENSVLIEKFVLRYINPFRDPKTIPAGEAKLAAQEINSLLERSPGSLVVQEYARLFMVSR